VKNKILILSGNGPPAIAAVNIYIRELSYLHEIYIIEEKRYTLKRILKTLGKRINRKGILSCIDLILGKLLNPLLFRTSKIKRIYNIEHTVNDINCDIVRNIIHKLNPDYIISNACSIISSLIIDKATCPILNLHNGITPRYRGSGNIWALRENNPEFIGVTIHLVDKGIDTGKRVSVKKIAFNNNHNFSDIDIISFEHGASLIIDYIKNKKICIPSDFDNLLSRIYTLPGLSDLFLAYQNFRRITKCEISLEDAFHESFESQSDIKSLSELQKLHWHDDDSCKRRDILVKSIYDSFSSANWITLDVGCGDGRYKEILQPKKYIGCDYFVKKINSLKIVKCRADKLPFDDESFDCTLAIGLFQHIGNAQKTGDEILRVTRKGGFIIINTLRQFSLLELLVIMTFSFYNIKRFLLAVTILKRDYLSCKKIAGLLVARRYSVEEISYIFNRKIKNLSIKYSGILGSRIFSREMTIYFKC